MDICKILHHMNVVYYLHFLHVLAQFVCTFLFFLHFFLSFLHFFAPALSLQGLFPPDPPDLHLLQVTGHCFCTFFTLHLFFLHELHFLFLFLHVSLQGVARCKKSHWAQCALCSRVKAIKFLTLWEIGNRCYSLEHLILQLLSPLSFPTQSFPPSSGAGLLHFLVLTCFPLVLGHLALHFDHWLHFPQPPSTKRITHDL